jgi:uncharacterized protein YjaZ
LANRGCSGGVPVFAARDAGRTDTGWATNPNSGQRLVLQGLRRGGATSAAGVVIGLETICRVAWMEPNIEDRLVHLIAHEYVHVQQPAADADDPNATVLFSSELEGGAEFVAELICGSVSNTHLAVWTKGREKEIEAAFVADEDKTDLSSWLYNGTGTPQKPGDLGYWVGYRIMKAYYQHAPDKQAALRNIIQVQDAKAFLASSGWYPGIVLQQQSQS